MAEMKGFGHSELSSRKEDISGRCRSARSQNRTALYLRVSTPDQKPDLQYDGLYGYAERAGLDIVETIAT